MDKALEEHPGAARTASNVPPCELISGQVVDSTNQEARRRLREAADQTIILAQSQTAGRGRYGRWWYSPEGNLYCSIIVHPPLGDTTSGTYLRSHLERWGELSLLTALAVRKSIAPLLPNPESCLLKWPNDVLIAGRKVAGILLESASLEGAATSGEVSGPNEPGIWRLIIGIGVNLRHFPDDMFATSLWHEGAGVIKPRALLTRMIPYWQELYRHWREYGFAAIRCQWLACGYALEEVIRVSQGSSCVFGRFVTLDSGGALLLEPMTGPQVIEPRVTPPQETPHLIVPARIPKIAATTKLPVRITSGELFFPQQTAELRCCSR